MQKYSLGKLTFFLQYNKKKEKVQQRIGGKITFIEWNISGAYF